MATFAELQARVEKFVLDLPSDTQSQIPELINDAIRDAQTRHNFRAMEASQEFTTTEGSHTLGQVTSLKERRGKPWLRQEDGSNKELEWLADFTEIVRDFDINDDLDDGEPKAVFQADADGNFEVYPFPDGSSNFGDGEYRVNVPYWRWLPALASDGDTNWFTERGELYIRDYAVGHAWLFNFNEARATVWLSKAEREFAKLISMDKRARSTSRGVLVPRSGALSTHISGSRL